jgi:tellurite resistance protein
MSEDVRITAAKWFYQHDQRFKVLPPMDIFEVYAKSLMCCANADGKLVPAEREWVCGYFASQNAPQAFIDELRRYPADEDVLKLVAKFPAVDGSRRSLLFDAIRASSADGEFHEKERAAIEKLADKFGISKAELKTIEQAYLDEKKATEHRLKVVFPNGFPF